MTREQEEKIQAMAAERARAQAETNAKPAYGVGGCQQQAGSGAIGMATKAPSFRERIRDNIRHSKKEAHRAELLMELEYLLDKNPDVARILELIEEDRALG